MTTTIHADGPLYVGPPYATASFNEFVTVLHVLVGAVFVLSGLVAMVAVAVVAFGGRRGCGPSRASVIALPAMVVSFVTGASTTVWAAAGPDRGLLTLLAATGLVVVVGWFIAWRERLWWAAYSAASGDGAEGAPQ
jgi:ascorbate-specific PTS system EIIC-type component UlaA